MSTQEFVNRASSNKKFEIAAGAQAASFIAVFLADIVLTLTITPCCALEAAESLIQFALKASI